MNQILLSLYLILLPVLTFYGCRVRRPAAQAGSGADAKNADAKGTDVKGADPKSADAKGSDAKRADAESPDEFLGLSQSKMMRAAACIGVILHHLTQQVTGYGAFPKGPVTILNYCGILFTAVFFFFSGYGLISGLYNKKDYLNGFLRKRLLSVLIPFWVINTLGVLLRTVFYGAVYSVKAVLFDITGITLVNSNGWYIIEIAIFYILFYLIFSLIKNRKAAALILCLIVAAVIVLPYWGMRAFSLLPLPSHTPVPVNIPLVEFVPYTVNTKSQWFNGEWWYNSTVTFIFGIIFALRRFSDPATEESPQSRTDLRFAPVGSEQTSTERLSPPDQRSGAVKIVIYALLFAAALSATVYTVDHLGYYRNMALGEGKRCALITLAVQSLTCLLFMNLVIALNRRIAIGNRVLGFLSGISTELFLIHGYFLTRIFGDREMPDTLRFAVVLACSIACAAVVSPPVRALTALAKRDRRSDGKKKEGGASSAPSGKTGSSAVKRNKMKVIAIMTAVLIPAALLMQFALRRMEFGKELEALRTAQAGDIVYWGRFDTDGIGIVRERLTWRVIRREGDRVCLISEKGIAGSCYHNSHVPTDWEKSDLRAYLNSKTFTEIFSAQEKGYMERSDGDLLTLLTQQEARELFTDDKDRELDITAAAEARGTNINRMTKVHNWDMKGYRSAWWWLRGDPGVKSVTAPIVTPDGIIQGDHKFVNKPGGAVRPVIRLYID